MIKDEIKKYPILDHLLEGCQIIGFDWSYQYINKTAAIHNRCSQENLIGKKYTDTWPGVEKTEVYHTIKHCLEERISHHIENRFTFPDGTQGWFDLSIQPVPEGVFILSIDITERKLAEEKLKESEARLSVIFHHSPLGILMTQLDDGKIVDINSAFADLYGYTRDEMIGRSSNDLNLWADPAERKNMLLHLQKHGTCKMEIKAIKKNGDLSDFSISAELIKISDKFYTIGIFQDITDKKETEENLKNLVKRYQLISENTADVIWTIDLTTGKFTYVSPSVFNLRGMTYEEVLKQPMQDAMTAASFQLVTTGLSDRIKAFYSGDKSVKIATSEVDQIHKNESIIPTEVVTTLITDSNNVVVEILGVSRDVSERKRVELELRESESKFRKIYEDGPFGMVVVNSEFKFISSNATFCRMIGYSEQELKNKTFNDISHPDDGKIDLPNIQKLILGEIPVYRTEKRYICKNGQEIWGALTVSANFNNEGKFIYNVAIIENITGRKKTEAELSKITERLELATHAANIGIWDWDIVHNKLVWDKQMFNLYGFKNDTDPEVYETWLNGVHPDDREYSNEISKQAVNGQREYDTEFRVVWPDKSVHWLKAMGQVFFDDNQRPVRMVGVNYDITDQKLAAEAVLKIKTKLETALESMTDAIFISDKDGYFIEFNDAFATFHKFKNKEECAKKFSEYPVFMDVFTPDGKVSPVDQWAVPRALRGEKVSNEEYILRRKDTGETWVGSYSFSPIRDNEGMIVGSVVVGRDITEQKNDTKNKRELETKFGAIFNSSPIAFAIYAMDGTLVEVNPEFTRLSGFSYQELIGKTSLELNLISSDDRQRMLEEIQQSGGSLENFEMEIIRRDGSSSSLLVSSKIISINGIPHRLGINVDIHQRKQAELLLKEKTDEIEAQNEEYQQLNEELVQTNEELEEAKDRAEKSDQLKTAFLQNMSHEIRTPMNAIMGFTELLAKNYNNKAKLEKFSEIINQRCNDLLEIINEILDVAKIESGQFPVKIEECKLDLLFSEIALFFKEIQKKQNKQHLKFTIQSHCSSSVSIILTDKVKLNQILINLIGNAFKFTDKGEIHAGCKLDLNNRLLFYVSDTGIGIPSDKQNFIFERFAQLEPTPDHLYGGTGLGLSIVKGLIDLLGGKIWLESEVMKGSTFYFTIPYGLVNAKTEEQLSIEASNIHNFSNKRLLIVEDDQYNVEYIKEVLDETGIKIIHTFYGAEAVKIAKFQDLDIVLMDIRLPDMDGYLVTSIIRKYKPDLKIIAQTAYAAQEDKEKAINAGCNDYISKPVRREALLNMIYKQLNKS